MPAAMLTKLKALDRLAIRSMATISRKCPQASLEILVDLLPADLMVTKTGLAAYCRLRRVLPSPCMHISYKNKLHSTPHLQYWEDQTNKLNLCIQATDQCEETIWEKSYHVNLDSFDGDKKHRKHSEYTAYTDGSKTDYGTGAGFVLYHKKEVISHSSIKLNDNATVFQAEITAIKQAADYLHSIGGVKFVKLLVDSQAALLALESKEVKAKSVLEAMQSLEQLSLSGATVRTSLQTQQLSKGVSMRWGLIKR